jgi:hypothetical protein
MSISMLWQWSMSAVQLSTCGRRMQLTGASGVRELPTTRKVSLK